MRLFIVVGAVCAGLGVAAGAFGAHSLKSRLDPAMLAVFETGVRYQLYHALALLVVGLWGRGRGTPVMRRVGWLFVGGIVLFSGSLYVLALTGTRWFGAITPLGGLAFIIGWSVLAWSFLKQSAED